MKKVIIIGGGIAGLTAGIYAAQCGFDTTIYEKHAIAGGNCTSWKRGSYLFEGGMHWLTGASEKEPSYKVWRNIGAIDKDTKIIREKTFVVYDHEGTDISLHCDADRLEAHLLSLSPQDKKPIKRLCKDMRILGKMSMPVTDIKGLKSTRKNNMPLSMLFSMIPALIRISALNKLSCSDYIGQFAHPGIQNTLRLAMTEEDYFAIALVSTLADKAANSSGFPEGGSLPFIRRIVNRYEALGGRIEYKSPVERVIVKNGRAVGVAAKGQHIDADAVIVTLDTMTADRLFDNPLKAKWLDTMRQNVRPVACCFVCIGVDADLSDFPYSYGFRLDTPLQFAETRHDILGMYNYANVPGYSPKGKTALTVLLAGDTYDYWKKIMEQGCYAAEKKKLADMVSAAIVKKIPRIEGKIEVLDVATPLTYERYCGTWKGSWMTMIPKNSKMEAYPCKVDHIENCYFAGQRMYSVGGLPVAALTGRTAVQHLCRDTEAIFQEQE